MSGKLILPRRLNRRTKWAILMDDRYLSREDGGIVWDYDREKLEKLAKEHGGRVVDAEDLRLHPQKYLSDG